MKYSVSKATVDDAMQIAVVGYQSFRQSLGKYFTDSGNLDQFLDKSFSQNVVSGNIRRGEGCYYVCKLENAVIGFARLIRMHNDDDSFQIERFYFSPMAHGSGAAETTMNEVKREVIESGSRSLWLSVYVENLRAIRFYEKMGFIISRQHFAFAGTQRFLFNIMISDLSS